jgi:nucleotide-binding universal stress UspA family protein
MSTIIVATDFSTAADNAALYGAALADETGASLLLVHVYQLPVTISDMPVMMVSPGDLQKSADVRLKEAVESVLKSFPNVSVSTQSRLGAVESELALVSSEVSAILIIAGNERRGGVEKLFFGNTMLSVIRDVAVPVIGVPSDWQVQMPLKVALATDLRGMTQFPYAKTKELVTFLQGELHVIHVQTEDEEDVSAEMERVQSELGVTCEIIRNSDYVEAIGEYITRHGIDLLALVPHRHTFLERVFFKTHTASLMEKINIPVLCVPE